MTVFATEPRRFSNLVKNELWPESAYCRRVVVANEAVARSYVVGTALGRVTTGGKYRVAVQTASDGSQVVDALVLREVTVPATTDVNVLVLFKGPSQVSKFGILLDATFDNDAKRNAAYAALEAKGIDVLEAV